MVLDVGVSCKMGVDSKKRAEIGQLIFALFGTTSRVFTRRILKLIVNAILKYFILKITLNAPQKLMEEFLLCPEIEGYFFLFEPRD